MIAVIAGGMTVPPSQASAKEPRKPQDVDVLKSEAPAKQESRRPAGSGVGYSASRDREWPPMRNDRGDLAKAAVEELSELRDGEFPLGAVSESGRRQRWIEGCAEGHPVRWVGPNDSQRCGVNLQLP